MHFDNAGWVAGQSTPQPINPPVINPPVVNPPPAFGQPPMDGRGGYGRPQPPMMGGKGGFQPRPPSIALPPAVSGAFPQPQLGGVQGLTNPLTGGNEGYAQGVLPQTQSFAPPPTNLYPQPPMGGKGGRQQPFAGGFSQQPMGGYGRPQLQPPMGGKGGFQPQPSNFRQPPPQRGGYF